MPLFVINGKNKEECMGLSIHLINKYIKRYKMGRIYVNDDESKKFFDRYTSNSSPYIKKFDFNSYKNYSKKLDILTDYVKNFKNFVIICSDDYHEVVDIIEEGDAWNNYYTDVFLISTDLNATGHALDWIDEDDNHIYLFNNWRNNTYKKFLLNEQEKTYDYISKNTDFKLLYIRYDYKEEDLLYDKLENINTKPFVLYFQDFDKNNEYFSHIISKQIEKELDIDVDKGRFNSKTFKVEDVFKMESLPPFISKISFSDGSELDFKDGLLYSFNCCAVSKDGWYKQFWPGTDFDTHKKNNLFSKNVMFFTNGKLSEIQSTHTGCREPTGMYFLDDIKMINNMPYPNVIIKAKDSTYCNSVHSIAYYIKHKFESVNDYPSYIEFKKDSILLDKFNIKTDDIKDKSKWKLSIWHKAGLKHREDGPAYIDYQSNIKKWYLYDKEYSLEEYKKELIKLIQQECEEVGICKDIGGIIGEYTIDI